MFDKTAFATRLRELRKEKEWTIRGAAEKCGIAPSTYSAYESKTSAKTPPLDVAVQIAEGYGVSLNQLCGMEEVKPPEAPKAAEPPAEDHVYTCAEVARLLLKLEKQQNIEILATESYKDIKSTIAKAGLNMSDIIFPVQVEIFSNTLSRFFLVRKNLKDTLSRSNPYNSPEIEILNQETYETWENAQMKQLESISLSDQGREFNNEELPF